MRWTANNLNSLPAELVCKSNPISDFSKEKIIMAQQITVNPDTMQEVGDNIKAAKQGNLMVIVIDTAAPTHPSKSGAMDLNASTGGFASFPGGWRGNINFGKKA
jgi:hypothetical protein